MLHKNIIKAFILLILILNVSTVNSQDNDPQYVAEIARADEAFELEEFEKAQKHYRKALEIKPGAKYPLYRLEDSRTLDEMKKARERKKDDEKVKNRDDAYKNAILLGDREFKAEHYDVSKDAYLEALTIKHWEPYPKEQIEKINKILFQKQQDLAYQNAIDLGDVFFNAEEYYKARDKYTEALTIKPNEEYPKQKLQKIDEILGYLKNQAAYDRAIEAADKLYYSKQYKEAKDGYLKALKILDKQYPKDQIKKINDLLAEQNENYAYQLTIEKADKLYYAENYTDARSAYQEASDLEPAEQYPKDQIAKIDAILANQDKIAEYNRIIEEADELFRGERYTPAKETYQQALDLMPNKQYPKDQIAKIEQLIALQNKEVVYNSIIQKADAHFNSEEYLPAKNKYQEALGIIPEKQYPKDQIVKIDQLLAAQNKENAYALAISKADKLFNEKSYSPAKTAYQEALAIFPDKMYPKTQIEKIDALLAKVSKDNLYNQIIADADRLFSSQTYLESRSKYKEALEVKENEQYPKDKIAEIEKILAEQSKTNSYNAAIEKADALFNEKSYSPAKNTYQYALEIIPEKEYPKKQIEKINLLLEELAKDNSYLLLVAEADKLFNEENYLNSKKKYQEASGVKPAEEYPKRRIAEIEAILAAQNKLNAYNLAIAKADEFFNEKSYSPAKVAYQDALVIFPDKEYPKTQIQKINALLAAKANDEHYVNLINEADNLFSAKKYIDSKKKYTEAIGIKPQEQYPEDQIVRIDNLLAEQQKLEKYNSSIASADKLFNEKQYSQAKIGYNDALKVIPEEQYPKDQIGKIDQLLANQKKEQDYNNLVAKADNAFNLKQYTDARNNYNSALSIFPDREYPIEQITKIDNILAELNKRTEYNNAVKQADIQFNAKQYAEAKKTYEKALELYSDEEYPQNQIVKIENLLALQRKQSEYQSRVKIADDKFNAKQYAEAKSSYSSALEIFPEEQYPKGQIQKIDLLMAEQAKRNEYNLKIAEADNLFNQKQYNPAKKIYEEASIIIPAEKYPQDQIQKINAIIAQIEKENQYASLISEADKLFEQMQYNPSKGKYQTALGLYPDKQYPKDQIAKIDGLIQQQAIDTKYNDILKQADGYYNAKQYKYALVAYKDASGVKPMEAYPKEQIAIINAILNAPKPEVETPKMDIPVVEYEDFGLDLAKADSLEIEKAYQKAISKGKSSHAEKFYSAARFYYSKAHEFKPKESFPVEQLQIIEGEMKEILSNRNNKSYFDLLQRADNAFKDGYYAIAEYYYLFALSVKPTEVYPQQKLKEIQKIISEKKAGEDKQD